MGGLVMEALNYITRWVDWLLIIIPVGAGTVVTYYAVSKTLSFDCEHKGHCNVRIRQTIKGAIIGMTVSGLIAVLKRFYISGGGAF